MRTNYKNLKYIPTRKIKAILDSPYTSGIDGADYGPVKEELQYIHWSKVDSLISKLQSDYEKQMKEYEDFLDSQGVPQVSEEIFNETFWGGIA